MTANQSVVSKLLKIQKYLSDIHNFYFFWLLLFFLFRALALVLRPDANLPFWKLLGAGFWIDLIVIIGFSLVNLQLKKIKPGGRSLQLLLTALLLFILFVNAIFVSWAHFPIDFSFLSYLGSIPQLWFSAGIILQTNWFAVLIITCIALFVFLWWYGRVHKPELWKFIPVGFIITFAATSLFHLEGKHSSYLSALSENVFYYSFSNFFHVEKADNKLDSSATSIRRILDHSDGTSHYLSASYPLMKERLAFGKRKAAFSGARFSKPPNVVLIFMESFRANDIGAYNPQKKHLTPVFDKLASAGWLWKNFYANGMQTSRAALAALTSVYSPLAQSVAMSDPDFPLLGLGEILSTKGYKTHYSHNGSLAFANKTSFFTNMGFDTISGGKDLVTDFDSQRVGWGIPDHLLFSRIADDLNKKKGGDPIFLTIFTVSNHHPWKTPLEETKIVKGNGGQYSTYKNSIHYSDYSLGILFEKLKPAVLENTVFIITADTAQPMGEHDGNFTLHKFLYEENVRIPFLIYSPTLLANPTHNNEIASQVDIVPTLLDLLGIKTKLHGVGRSLLAQPKHTPFAYFSNPYTGGWVGLRQGKHKFFYHLKSKARYLYDLQKDPEEISNIARQHPATVSDYLNRTDNIHQATMHLINKRNLLCETCL